jgi:hypothetical protein
MKKKLDLKENIQGPKLEITHTHALHTMFFSFFESVGIIILFFCFLSISVAKKHSEEKFARIFRLVFVLSLLN